jgi:hypothetical protein
MTPADLDAVVGPHPDIEYSETIVTERPDLCESCDEHPAILRVYWSPSDAAFGLRETCVVCVREVVDNATAESTEGSPITVESVRFLPANAWQVAS